MFSSLRNKVARSTLSSSTGFQQQILRFLNIHEYQVRCPIQIQLLLAHICIQSGFFSSTGR